MTGGTIRPEARATLRRWGEVLFAAGLIAVGLWMMATALGLFALFGVVLATVGGVMLPRVLRRLRMGAEAEAPGVVEIVEGRIAYFGPVSGGATGLDLLTEVALRHTPDDAAWWMLSSEGARPLLIPAGARGAEELPEALLPLPGWSTEAAAAALRARAHGVTVLWRRTPAAALPRP
jgi:hypothetical protein